MRNDLRAQALLDQLAAIEKATAPPSTKVRRTGLAAVVLTWVAMGMVTNWDPTAPGMLVFYSLTGQGPWRSTSVAALLGGRRNACWRSTRNCRPQLPPCKHIG
jgi:hypothetical protein